MKRTEPIFGMKNALRSLLLGCLLPLAIQAQQAGLPVMEVFGYEDYKSYPQNWGLTFGQEGLLYVANNEALLTYDGVRWQKVLDKSFQALATGSDGRIYAGGTGELGYLETRPDGSPQFQSLRERIPKGVPLEKVWRIHALPQGVFFYTDVAIFRYDGEQIEAIFPQTDGFWLAFAAEGQYFFQELGAGLFSWQDGEAVLLESDFCTRHFIMDILPDQVPDAVRLVATHPREGSALYRLHLKTGQVDTISVPRLDNQKLVLNRGIAAPDERLFLAENYRGLGLFELIPEQKVLRRIDKSKGLPTDLIHDMATDAQGGLWLALDEGLAHLETHTPVSVFDERNGLSGPAYAMKRFRDTLYVGTTQGLFFLDESKRRFQRIQEGNFWLIETVWTASGETLLASSTLPDASWEVRGKKAEPALNKAGFISALRPTDTTGLIVARNDIHYLTKENGVWAAQAQHWVSEDIDLYYLQADADDNLWALSESEGLFRVADYQQMLGRPADKVQVRRYDTLQGLPSMDFKKIRPFIAEGTLHLATHKGVFRFDAKTDRFVSVNWIQAPDSLLSGERIFNMVVPQRHDGRFWVVIDRKLHVFDQKGGYLAEESRPFQRLPRPAAIEAIYEDADRQELWIGTTERLYHYDGAMAFTGREPFQTFIRQVQSGQDSLLFRGTRISTAQANAPTLPYQQNRFTFYYATNFLTATDQMYYQYRLDNYDAGWSAPTQATRKEYTNLDEGSYTFRVRGINAYGVHGKEASYTFEVLPPWYRQWWAFLLYLILTLLIVWGVTRWNADRLRRDKARLEHLVGERTQELEEANANILAQKEELSIQTEQLTQANEKLTDSIRYARTIQGAILPNEAMLSEALGNYFLVYQPKDIVSGDFYWLLTTTDGYWFALVDCTGHGVPGAFMSMVGKALLDEAIKERQLERPSEVLEWLDRALREALRQDQDANNDGMDISLIRVLRTAEATKVTFAGAGQHLLFAASEGAEITRFKGTNRSIGGKKRYERPFKDRTLSCTSGCRLYLYSDGIIDMGNKDGERFGTRNLVAELQAKQNLSANDQKTHFTELIENFQQGAEQRDDITLAGICFTT